MHVHIGHHFYGAGNLGDDLMLAGFLEAARPAFLASAALSCCTPHDIASQRRRFPEIRWLPYTPAVRARAIAQADVWLGLGGTPFQAAGGQTWMLDHLGEEAAWCRQFGTPMFYLGVGVNERATADLPQMHPLLDQAERLWMRDDASLEMLGTLAAPGKATAHADLAHLALATMHFPPAEPDILGLVLNFEDAAQYRIDDLATLTLTANPAWRVRWLAQEVRPLIGSETWLHERLPSDIRGRVPLLSPDYAGTISARGLLAAWEGVEALFVSRYHASLAGAWMGARVGVFARSAKVAGAARQLGLSTVATMDDVPAILRVMRAARPVARTLLQNLNARARAACEEFFALAAPRRAGSRPLPAAANGSILPARETSSRVVAPPSMPSRILFLRPDAYGDLCLFEPVPRILRHAWPDAEIAVLVRQPYADAAPLLVSEGVHWLTTDCNPYREAPGENPAALDALRDTVRAFAPDCLVAACVHQTWLEAAVAMFLPDVRQISLGQGLTDPCVRAALEDVLPVDWANIYPEKIVVESDGSEWKQNLRLASALLGHEAPAWWPVAHVPEAAGARAAEIIAAAGLTAGEFVVCAAAGTANVPIKHWPAEQYGEILAWLERERGVRSLLIGHVSEHEHLETVLRVACTAGANPALWEGQDGEMPVVAGLLAASRFYFGNDTGALHLAAALKRPVVAIFGGGTWPRFAPVAARARAVVQTLPCFGCAWDCLYVDAPCVRTISTGSVRKALEQILETTSESHLIVEAEGLDAGARRVIDTATPRLRFLREDSADRLRQITELTLQTGELSRRLQTSDADRDARQNQVDELTALLKTSEADRDARQSQIQELTALLAASETDRDTRQTQVHDLTVLLTASESDRAARLGQIDELTALLKVSDADRPALRGQLEELTALLKVSDADRDARLQHMHELGALLETSESDRAARLKQVEGLTALLAVSEADRAARLRQIEELTASSLDDGTEPVPHTVLPAEFVTHPHVVHAGSDVLDDAPERSLRH